MYWSSHGWTLNRETAQEFETAVEAMTFIVGCQLKHAEVVTHAPESELNEVVVAG